MKAIIRYIVKNIVSTPVISIVILVVLSLSSGLFCVAFDFKRQVMQDAVQDRLTQLGDSTFFMTFDEASSVRFFTLNALRRADGFDQNDFEYIIGGYTFTSVLKTQTTDFPVKVHSYRDTSDTALGGDKAAGKFSDVRFVQSREDPIWFDDDLVIPQKIAQRLDVGLGDKVFLVLGSINKEMTVTGIAENSGLFAEDNILVDYEGLLSAASSLLPAPLPPNVFNTALFKLKQPEKADFYMALLGSADGYGDKVIQLSLDYDDLYERNKVKIATREAVVFLLIILLLIVVFFIVQGRLRAHGRAIKTLLEQGAGGASLCLIFLLEIFIFGLAATLSATVFIRATGLAGSVLPSLLCVPLCLFAYLTRFAAPLLRRKKLRAVLFAGVAVVSAVLFFFALNLFIFLLLLTCLAVSVAAAGFLTRLFCGVGGKIGGKKQNNGKIGGKADKAAAGANYEDKKTEQTKEEAREEARKQTKNEAREETREQYGGAPPSPPQKRAKNRGMLRSFAALGADRTSGVFLVVNSILLVIVMLYFSYVPVINNLLDPSDAGYVMTNIAAAGGDLASEVGQTEGVEKAIPVYWKEKSALRKADGEEIYSYVITVRRDDYRYAQKMLSLGGGQDALGAGGAVISTGLSKKLGVKAGQTLKIPINGKDFDVKVSGVIKSGLVSNIIVIESDAIDLPYNNIFLKLNEDKREETLNLLRTRYGLQNMLIIEKSDLVSEINNTAGEFLAYILLVLTIVATSSFIILLCLFLIKKSRERQNARILAESGASPSQVYGISALSLMIASSASVIIGFLLSFLLLFIMRMYFEHLGTAVTLNAFGLLPTMLLAQGIIFAAYMLTHAFSHFWARGRRK